MTITSLPSGISSAPGQSLAERQPKLLQSLTAPSGSPSRAPDPRQKALELVEQTLAKAYEKMGLRIEKSTGSYTQFEPLTAEKVADNILGFISRRLQMDLADGATPEQLQSRLDAGLSGFKKGFAEASEQLKALSMLSPEIKQDIGKTYDLVIQGIEQLQSKFIPGKTTAPAVPEPSAKQGNSPITAFNQSYQYASASSFSFELMTAEGDRVTISAASSRSQAANYTSVSNDRATIAGAQVASSSSSSLSWTVEGDLNEKELGAINKLLNQVNQMAGEFFNGNLDTAFNQALALGYDKEQITEFSLSLTRIEIQKVSTAYQTFNGKPAEGINLAEKLLPVGHFIQHLLDTIDALETFPQPKKMITDAAEKMIDSDVQTSAKPAERFRLFVEQILSSMEKV